MNAHKPASLLVASSAVIFALSCASTPPSPLSYTVERVSMAEPSAIDAAEVVLTQIGYRIARRDAQEGILITQPLEGSPADVPSRQGAGLSSNAATRRFVEVRFEDAADGTVRVFCKVAIQEQVTQAYQMFHPARAGDDTPNETAIDRDAASTAAQNTVWQTVARDKRAERVILTAIAERAKCPRLPASTD